MMPGTESRNALLEAHPLASKVRKVAVGVGACTWWDDEACLEFARLVEEEGAEDMLEGMAFRLMVTEGMRGERGDKLTKFVESRSYPEEPVA